METISKDCNKCVHNDVCRVKGCLKEAEEKILNSGSGNIHPCIEIKINCTKFLDESLFSEFKAKGSV